MGVECRATKGDARHGQPIARNSGGDQRDPGNQEKPPRAEQQAKSQRAPAVPEGVQVRRVRLSSVRMQRYGYFLDTNTVQARLDDHLDGKFHPGATQVETPVKLAGKSTQAAIDV